MNNDSMEQYLRTIAKVMYDSTKRSKVIQELTDTIEDFTEAYMSQGMSKADAIKEALRQMGNPKETGQLFNKIYRVKYDWKILIYMFLWSVISHGILVYLLKDWQDFLQELSLILTVVGGTIIGAGVLLSVMEKWLDLPFFYAYGKNWNGGYLSNSGMICGIGTGILPFNISSWFLVFAAVATIIMLQRSYMTEKRNQKEQKYLWELAIAKEDFEYKGHVLIGEEEIKVQAKKGIKVKKGEQLIVVGMTDFTLIVDTI